MKLAIKISEGVYTIDGNEFAAVYVNNFKYRIHLPNGDVEIYEAAEDIPVVVYGWDIDEYKLRVNDAHNALFRRMYNERNYLSIGELTLWLNDVKYGDEALMLRNWWLQTCKTVEEYLSNVDEETAISIEEFIQSLPILAP